MAKRKQPKNRKQIKRQTRHFQLRVEHPIDQHVAEILDYKRSKRSEVTAIRDGVRLLWALENGDLAVLFEMFPQYRTQFTPGGAGGGDDLQQIKSMLEIVVASRKSNELLMQSAAAPASETKLVTGKLLGGKVPMPVFDEFEDDDQPTVILNKSSVNAAANFLGSLSGLG